MSPAPASLIALLEAARELRTEVLSLELFRLFDGAGDGNQSLVIDRIGPFCLAHLLLEQPGSAGLRDQLVQAREFFTSGIGISSLYLRQHDRDPRATSEQAAELLFGPPVKDAVIHEHGIALIVRPEVNVNAGVFLDTRETRRFLLENSRGARVLNTFCFTGSLGVAAYCGGASEVVQLDSSRAMLEWSKENFALNGPDALRQMRFIQEDCVTFLKREVRRVATGRARYGIVVLDPPSFGKAGSKTFQLKRDLPELVALAFGVLDDGGTLLLSANSREITPDYLNEICRNEAAGQQINIRRVEALSPPKPDFTAGYDSSSSMRGLRIQISRS